jgi:proline iminopeptidase
MDTGLPLDSIGLREGYIPVTDAELYYRATGRGRPVLVLHGGPDFDHNYFLPELDHLAGSYRLIYYDQRGRGKSSVDVKPEEVSIRSEMADLEAVRTFFRLESAAVLGHSWGGLLAMEYAIRYPERVSHLILLNTAPASHEDAQLMRASRGATAAGELEKMSTLASTSRFRAGDPEIEADYYRLHFRSTLRQPEQLGALVGRLRANFRPADIIKAREIESRLYDETLSAKDYNLFPMLARLRIPALVIHGDHDHIPVECAEHIVQAIHSARFVILEETGHFSFMENPVAVQQAIGVFLVPANNEGEASGR